MKSLLSSIMVCALCCLALPAVAQTVYVTDNLRLGLHNEADTSDRPFRVLDSGQEMTVLNRNTLYALVRLPDGVQGYVKTGYLIDKKPAKAIVAETLSQNEALAKELAEVKSAFAGSAGRISELESQLAEQNAALSDNKSALGQLSSENDNFRDRLSLYRLSLPWPFVLGAAFVALILGAVAGVWWIDHRSRRRHGGFRIY